ncbi:MAG: N-acetylneuraminate lyase, partial [Lentisphaerota bacterium]
YNINESDLRKIVRHNIDCNKVDGLYIGGSTGENFKLTLKEKKEVFRIAIDEASGSKVQLIAQVGGICLDETLELAEYSTGLGYKCLSAVTPFYYKLPNDALIEYYEAIVNKTNNNMLIYTIPSLTGVNMDISVYRHLLLNEKIIGVKYTSTDLYFLERLINQFPNKLFFYGIDELLFNASVLKICGAIGSIYNIDNKQRGKSIFSLVQQNKIAEARKINTEFNSVIEIVDTMGVFEPLKETLKQMDVISSSVCKKPVHILDNSEKKNIAALIQKYLK